MCVCQCWHRTHTPLSLSHYQLAFHPVNHPSVQMVRKAASVLSLSLILPSLYTLSFGEKKKKGYASDRLEPNRGRIQIGCQVDLTAWKAASQRAEFRSVTAPARAPFYFLLGWYRIQIKGQNSSATHLYYCPEWAVPAGCLPSVCSEGGQFNVNFCYGSLRTQIFPEVE